MEALAAVGSVAAAIGTLIVALFTWNLARATKAMAKATLEAARASNAMVRTAQEGVAASRDQLAVADEQARAMLRQVEAAQEQVRATNQQAELARLTLNTSIQPLLVDVPRGGDPVEEQMDFPDHLEHKTLIHHADQIVVAHLGLLVRCSIPFRNVGAGVALINGATLHFGNAYWTLRWITSTIVPPGQMTRVSFSIPMNKADQPELEQNISTLTINTFEVDVYYNNAGDSRPILTKAVIFFNAAAKQHEPYYVRQILLFDVEGYKRGESEAFAGSGPAR